MLSKTIKRAGLLVAVAVMITGGYEAVLAQETNLKIAVVDIERVFVTSEDGKALQGQLDTFLKDAQTGGQALADAAQEIQRRADEGGQSLSPDKIAELKKAFEDKQIEMRRYQDDKQREGEKMKNEGLQEIEKKVRPIIEAIRTERGYDLILNNVPGIVVMANEKVDITQAVIDRLNQG